MWFDFNVTWQIYVFVNVVPRWWLFWTAVGLSESILGEGCSHRCEPGHHKPGHTSCRCSACSRRSRTLDTTTSQPGDSREFKPKGSKIVYWAGKQIFILNILPENLSCLESPMLSNKEVSWSCPCFPSVLASFSDFQHPKDFTAHTPDHTALCFMDL